MTTFDIIEHGAVGDGSTNDGPAIQAAIDACAAAGGGRVLIPSGHTFTSGTIELRSFVELHLEPGSVLAASSDEDAYTVRRATTGLADGRADDDPDLSTMFVTAEGCESIAITGTGTIDGGGRHFVVADLGHAYEMAHVRPYTIYLLDCERVVIRDITVRDAAYWTLRLSGCRGIAVQGITIRNDLKLPNSDGIDIDTCQRVRVSDCDIVTGDDGICIKTCRESRRFGACKDVTVVGCTIVSTSSGICFGSELASPISNCVFSSCVISASNRGLAMQLSEGGLIENVLFSDLIVETRFFHSGWWGHGEPIYIVGYPWRGTSGRVRNVRFRNVLARSENGVVIRAEEAETIRGVELVDVRVEIDRWSGHPGGEWDLRPHPQGMLEHSTSGFHVERVSDVEMRHCKVVWAQPVGLRADDMSNGLTAIEVDGLRVTDFVGDGAHPESDEGIVIEDSRKFVVQ